MVKYEAHFPKNFKALIFQSSIDYPLEQQTKSNQVTVLHRSEEIKFKTNHVSPLRQVFSFYRKTHVKHPDNPQKIKKFLRPKKRRKSRLLLHIPSRFLSLKKQIFISMDRPISQIWSRKFLENL